MEVVAILFGVILIAVGLFLYIAIAAFLLGFALYVLLQFAILAEIFVIASSMRSSRFYGVLVLVSICVGVLWQQPHSARAVLPLVLVFAAPLRILMSAYRKTPGYWMSRYAKYKEGVTISTGISIALAVPLIAKVFSELTAGGT
ncbi:hypothetical protein KF728_22370 [Candidatus Obscuribacterales bacterium]|nr:hypothetical protein [Candidatus Obscuribacterales bacterium]MBX3152922.1 hypothetical protein [Candidatus Obscuribacterales bacterium]